MFSLGLVHIDTLRRCAEAAASSVGSVAGIVAGAASDITDEMVSLASELAEISRPADD